MATAVQVDHESRVVSVNGAQSNGREFRAGGNPLVVQFDGPAALNVLEGSMDKSNWYVLSDEAGTALTGIAGAIHHVRRAPKWVRHATLTDASAPRTFFANIGVIKESA